MTGKLLAWMLGPALFFAPSAAAATRLLIVPLPGEAQGGAAAVVSRAVESAALQVLPDLEVVTPGALEQKLELDLARACTGDGDDAACVVEFAAALGAEYVLRQRLSEVEGETHLTLSLYDGTRPQLLAQASRHAPRGATARLADQAADLVVEVARQARIPVQPLTQSPSLTALTLLGSGAAAVVLGTAGLGASALLDTQYFDAKLDRDGARAWEGARLWAYGATGAAVVTGAALLTVGALTWE